MTLASGAEVGARVWMSGVGRGEGRSEVAVMNQRARDTVAFVVAAADWATYAVLLHQGTAPSFSGSCRHFEMQGVGHRILFIGVCKNSQTVKFHFPAEVSQFDEVLSGLPGKTYDHCGSERHSRYAFPDSVDHSSEACSVASSSHRFEDCGAGML